MPTYTRRRMKSPTFSIFLVSCLLALLPNHGIVSGSSVFICTGMCTDGVNLARIRLLSSLNTSDEMVGAIQVLDNPAHTNQINLAAIEPKDIIISSEAPHFAEIRSKAREEDTAKNLIIIAEGGGVDNPYLGAAGAIAETETFFVRPPQEYGSIALKAAMSAYITPSVPRDIGILVDGYDWAGQLLRKGTEAGGYRSRTTTCTTGTNCFVQCLSCTFESFSVGSTNATVDAQINTWVASGRTLLLAHGSHAIAAAVRGMDRHATLQVVTSSFTPKDETAGFDINNLRPGHTHHVYHYSLSGVTEIAPLRLRLLGAVTTSDPIVSALFSTNSELQTLRIATSVDVSMDIGDLAHIKALVPDSGLETLDEIEERINGTFELESPRLACPEAASHCFVFTLGTPAVAVLDFITRQLYEIVPETPTKSQLLGAAYAAIDSSTVYVIGGFDEGSFSQATLRFDLNLRNGSYRCTELTSGLNISPPGRAFPTLTFAKDRLYLIGGLCAGSRSCPDVWTHVPGGSSWQQMTTASGSLTQRYAHSALLMDRTTTIGGVQDSLWIVVAGGFDAVVLFNPVAIAINKKVAVRMPGNRQFAGNRACLTFIDDRVMVIGGSQDGTSLTRAVVFSEVQGRWESFTPSFQEWRGGASSCAKMRTLSNEKNRLSTVVSVQSGPMDEGAISALKFEVVAPCDQQLNQVRSPSGQRCVTCPRGSLAQSDSESCSECVSQNPRDYPELWMRKQCLDGRDNSAITAAFCMLVALMITIPVMVFVVTRVLRVSEQMRKNENDATNIAHAVANLRFEQVSYLTNRGEDDRELSHVEQSLANIVRTTKRHRMFMPMAVLATVDGAVEKARTGSIARMDSGNNFDQVSAGEKYRANVAFELGSNVNTVYTVDGDDESLSTLTSQPGNSRILAALDHKCSVRDITVVHTSILNFYRWCESISRGSRSTLAKRLSKVYDSVAQIVQSQEGVVMEVSGDSILSVWNSAKLCPQHTRHALESVYGIATHKMIRSLGAELASGVATGSSFVGIAGSGVPRQPIVVSPALNEARTLGQMASRFRSATLMEWTPQLQNILSDDFVFRLLGLGIFSRVNTTLPRGATFRQPKQFVPSGTREEGAFGTAPGQSVTGNASILCELVAPSEDDTWVYEKKGLKEHIDTYNVIMRLVHRGSVVDARSLSLDGMPAWYQSELQEVLRIGKLREEFVDTTW